jgi:hypothetical protein
LNRLRHGFAGDGGREIGEIEIEISGQLALRRMKAEISKCEPALNPTLALVSVCGDISPSLQVMNLELHFYQLSSTLAGETNYHYNKINKP